MPSRVASIFSALLAFLLAHTVQCKVVNVELDSRKAAQGKGQYLTKFCFQGQTGVVRYSINETVAGGALYLFYDEVWPKFLSSQNCAERLQLANIKLDLHDEVAGERTMAQWFEPHFWYVIYADSKTCTDDGTSDTSLVTAELVFLNPDSRGLARNHFSVDTSGLLTFYELLFIVNIAGGYFFLHRMWQGISKGGPLNAAVRMVSAAAVLQICAILFMTMHLWRFSSNGVGFTLLKSFAEFLDTVSQFVMLTMLISLAFGWTLGPRDRDLWADRKVTGSLTLVAALMLWLFAWEQSMDEQHYAYRSHLTRPDILAVVLRLLLAVVFTINLHKTLAAEKSSLKREFYNQFATGCYIWFFAYPLIILLGYFFSECRRHSLIVIGVGLAQTVALVLLCRLFLTRSLYWSVSSLGGPMLPLRAESSSLRSDTTFQQKSYGSSVYRANSYT
ncbi:integral membrane protein GPR180-like [Sycon ciliatum]|uniref:integral membrane protein GPR180-like n=1 Tax=Sycon ciliatum TaxID=27933 RepID=UPI0020A9C8B4|eukprot:scpid80405/ scgid3669/ Integral membrane protein GPR180